MTRPNEYIEGLRLYHKKLEGLLTKQYNVKPEYLETLSWGYHTTAFYIKADNGKEYLLKMTDWSRDKEAGITKDVELSTRLGNVIPTPTYIKTNQGGYICKFENKLLRLSNYISGVAPLDMNFNVLEQMALILRKIHETDRPQDKNVLLHGDLTPHNVLVSFDKVVAVMDFELSIMGPREWDLARTAVFSWNYMQKTNFEEVAHFVLEKYGHKGISADLLYKYAVENAKGFLMAVEQYKSNYDRVGDWQRDRAFALAQLTKLLL